MFTGIIEAIGAITACEPNPSGDLRLWIDLGELGKKNHHLGDSIAVNGVCLTANAFAENTFAADVSAETLRLTTLNDWKIGTLVNLETALTPQKLLGGHWVSGHVDGLGAVVARFEEARSWRFQIHAPQNLARYLAHKGSVTVNGVSLTINHIQDNIVFNHQNGTVFDLNIVPHTLSATTLGELKVGDQVHLEVDVLARYLERLLQHQA